jgi:uncharacterized protein (UPF0276 family)
MINGVDAFQNAIGRKILIENPSNYLRFVSDMDEPEFLVEIAQRSGCGLLLDVNNVYVSALNTGLDAIEFIQALPPLLVGEIHVAGYNEDEGGTGVLIDTHGAPIDDQVWSLLEKTLVHTGPKPVLIERDQNIPTFDELHKECARAQELLTGGAVEEEHHDRRHSI